MRRGDLIDYPHRSRRAAVLAILTILVLGLALGGVLGTALSRGFEAANIEEFARQFSGS